MTNEMNKTAVNLLNKVAQSAKIFRTRRQSADLLSAPAIQYELGLRNIRVSVPEADSDINRGHLDSIFEQENGDPSQIQRSEQLNENEELQFINDELVSIEVTIQESSIQGVLPQNIDSIHEHLVHLYWRLHRISSPNDRDYQLSLINRLVNVWNRSLPSEDPDHIESSESEEPTDSTKSIEHRISKGQEPPLENTEQLASLPTPKVSPNNTSTNHKPVHVTHKTTHQGSSTMIPDQLYQADTPVQVNQFPPMTQCLPFHPQNNGTPVSPNQSMNNNFDMYQLIQSMIQQNQMFIQSMTDQAHAQRMAYEQSRRQPYYHMNDSNRSEPIQGPRPEMKVSLKNDLLREFPKQGIIFSANKTTDGKSIDIYFEMLDSFMARCKLSGPEIMEVIHGTLKAQPSTWYFSSFKKTARTFEEFRDALYLRFEDPAEYATVITKAAQIRYLGGGDLLTHVDRITTMLKRAKATEEVQVGIIKNSLPKDMQRFMGSHRPKTIDETYRLLKDTYPEHCPASSDTDRKQSSQNFQRKAFQTFQAIHAVQSESESNNDTTLCTLTPSVDEGSDDFRETEEEYLRDYEEICELTDKLRHRVGQFQRFGNRPTGTCYHCQKPGHIAPRCTFACGSDGQSSCRGNPKYCPAIPRKN